MLRSFQEDLPVLLSQSEWETKTKELVSTLDELGKHQDESKRQRAVRKSEEDTLQKKVDLLAEQVRTHKETRPVEVREELNEHRNIIEVVRVDSGEVIRTRPLTPEESRDALQGRLGFPGDA